MSMFVWELVVALVAGLAIESFFQLIKYRDSLNTNHPQPVDAYNHLINASNYMSVSQYLSSGKRKWPNYLLFRLLPPLTVFFLLGAIYDKYFGLQNYVVFMLFASVVSLRNAPLIFKAKYMSERLLHLLNVILVILVSVAVGILGMYVKLGFFAPSISGVIDNLWSSLLIALLVILYIKSTDMSDRNEDQKLEDVAVANYVISSFNIIDNKHSATIASTCEAFSCSRAVLYSVLIYENMNRPSWLRRIENLFVRIFKLNLTVGLAQVKSKIPLSDEESILVAAEILKNTDGFSYDTNIDEFRLMIKDYNPESSYADSVFLIIGKLKIYEAGLFSHE